MGIRKGIAFGVFLIGFFLCSNSVLGAVLSLDKVTIVSNAYPIVGDAFLVYISQVGTQDYLVGTETTFQTEEINQKLQESGYSARVTFPLTVKSTLKDRECWWNMYASSGSRWIVKVVLLAKKTCWDVWCMEDFEDSCSAQPTTEVIWRGAYPHVGYCIQYIPMGWEYYFSPDVIHYEVEFQASNSQESGLTTVTEKVKSAWVLPDRVWVEWTGNMVGERIEMCPTTDIEAHLTPIYFFDEDLYMTVDKGYFEEYISWCDETYCYGDEFRKCLNQEWPYGDWSVDDCIAYINNLWDNTFQQTNYRDPYTGQITELREIDGVTKLVLEMPQDYLIPTFRYLIKADWLGIYIPTGEPEIVSVIPTDIDYSGYGSVTFQVRNVGEEQGTFDAWVECPGDWVGGSTTLYVDPGEVETGYITIQGTCEEEEQRTCTLYVKDRASGVRVSEDFLLGCTPQVTPCPYPGYRECIGNVIRTCTEDLTWEHYVCSVGNCGMVDSYIVCLYEDEDGDGVLNIDDKCLFEPGLPEYDGCPSPPKPECEWWDIPCWIRYYISQFVEWVKESIINVLRFVAIIVCVFGAIYILYKYYSKKAKERFIRALKKYFPIHD